jgi:trypsin-like peptidase
MFVRANKKVKSAIFPLFRVSPKAPNQIDLTHLGAAFFIDDKGTFVTCAHLFDNAPAGSRFTYFGHLPENLQNPQIEIVELGRDDMADIVIGHLKMPNPTSYLELAREVPDPGKQVCIVGYPLAQIGMNAQGGVELGGVRRYPQPSFVIDGMQLALNDGRHRRGFCVRDIGHSGMSGGPVVDENGSALGMQSAVAHRKDKLGKHEIIVHNAMAIDAPQIRAVWETIQKKPLVHFAAPPKDMDHMAPGPNA